VLELTVRADAGELAPVRHRIAAELHTMDRSDAHIWRVALVASELLALSIRQGNDRHAMLRLSSLAEATRVELVDDLQQLAAFDSDTGWLVTRVAAFWGVLRDPDGTRTVWCDVTRESL
jgi:hypothetical protein